ncbi:IS66 family insertion sequence element accessory protein TnpB [Bradyrhizobium genosp. SA-3]|uniref:IS66 family insertion sequence element accessory protein TnpB n=1 Tax=Bradyrhizobium genosp. SA-3 TaxID=508868 RepID=UPI0010288A3C
MIAIPIGVRLSIGTGHTDMRRGMLPGSYGSGEPEARSPYRRSLHLPGPQRPSVKILWHDGLGMSLYAERLDRGKFISYDLVTRAVPGPVVLHEARPVRRHR